MWVRMTFPWPLRAERTSCPFTLQADTVEIWQVGLQQEPSTIAQFHELLNAEERQRAARFHFPADQRRYTVGRGMLRVLLGHYLQIPPAQLAFTYNAYGKPQLAGAATAALHFNLSHSGEFALYAITPQRIVGVDIELMRTNLDYLALARHVFSPAEQAVLTALPVTEQLAAFYRGWTRKEAFIKARGMGLSLPLDQFDVTLHADQPPQLLATRDDPQEASRWSIDDLPCPPGYAAAVVVAGTGWRTKLWNADRT